MNILVTGANGFLGSYLVKELVVQGHQVKALVRAGSDTSALENRQCIVYGDILNTQSMARYFNNLDTVFHVAGAMSSSPKDKESLFKVNVQGTKNVLDLCIENQVKKLIHVSSVVAIGASLKKEILDETSENLTLDKGYANYDSKRQGEGLVLKAAREGSIHATVVNPGLIYGARDAKKTIRKGNVQAARGKLPFYTSGGVTVVAIEDVVQAMITALKKGRSGERYLLTGDNITIQDLLTKIAKLAEAKEPTKLLPDGLLWSLAKVNDYLGLKTELTQENCLAATAFHWYDNKKAQQELDFKPKPWQEALHSSVQWMKQSGLLGEKRKNLREL